MVHHFHGMGKSICSCQILPCITKILTYCKTFDSLQVNSLYSYGASLDVKRDNTDHKADILKLCASMIFLKKHISITIGVPDNFGTCNHMFFMK